MGGERRDVRGQRFANLTESQPIYIGPNQLRTDKQQREGAPHQSATLGRDELNTGSGAGRTCSHRVSRSRIRAHPWLPAGWRYRVVAVGLGGVFNRLGGGLCGLSRIGSRARRRDE